MNRERKNTIIRMNELGAKAQPFIFIIDFLFEKPKLFMPEELTSQNIKIAIPGFTIQTKLIQSPPDFFFIKYPVDFSLYQTAFNKVLSSIHRGDTFLLNLTFPTQLETNLDIEEIFLLSSARFKLKYKDKFVVFSPEPFVQTNQDTIATFPMKGTIDAGLKNAEAVLMNDPKEIAEHNTIVDLLRNDLNMVSEKVKVKKFRYIEKIKTHEKTILQTSSEIVGQLPEGWQKNIGDILFKLLPAGSICGAPKRKTVEIIRDVELDNRDFFTGIFGYFNGVDLSSAVMIRYIEKKQNKLFFRSGGGITNFSDCQKEYGELIDKVYVPIIRDHQG